MKISHQQKAVIVLCSSLIVILSLITAFSGPDLTLKDTTDNLASQQEDAVLEQEYQAYLASIKTDPAASQKLMQELLPSSLIEEQINEALGLNKPVTIPVIPDSAVKISNQAGTEAVSSYAANVLEIHNAIERDAQALVNTLFVDSTNPSVIQRARDLIKQQVLAMGNVTVPKEALAFHKAEWIVLDQYLKTLDESVAYAQTQEADWANISDAYRIGDQMLTKAKSEAGGLDQKYALGLVDLAADTNHSSWNPFAIKEAHALAGPVIIIEDVPRKVEFTFREAIGQAFAAFTIVLTKNLLSRIEQTYRISNFLYYTDALVQGQYTDDYLIKYIADPSDRDLIKKFIPQFSCNKINRDELRTIFQAKSRQYLGFNPADIKPTDKDYAAKRIKLGNFFAAPSNWGVYMEDVAQQTLAESKNASFLELLAPGLKVSRTGDKRIDTYLQKAQSSVDKTIANLFNVGSNNAQSATGIVIRGAIESILSQFLFRGATTVYVYQEQKLCLKTVLANPLTAPATAPPDGPLPPRP